MIDRDIKQSRFSEGFYEDYQLNIDHGELSLPLVETLHSTYQNILKRFPHCFAYRFRLRIPNTQSKQGKTLINQWFYRLCHYRAKDRLSIIWQKEMSKTGAISYRVTIFINAESYPSYSDVKKIRKWLINNIERTWAKTIEISQPDITPFCILSPDPLMILHSDCEDYNEQQRFLFFIISRYAKSALEPRTLENELMGSFFSPSSKTVKGKNHE